MKTILLALALVWSSAHARTFPLIVFAGEFQADPAPALCYFSNNRLWPAPRGILVNYMCFGESEIYAQIWNVAVEAPRAVFVAEIGNLLSDPVVLGEKIYAMEYSEFQSIGLWQHDGEKAQRFALPAEWGPVRIQGLAPMGKGVVFRVEDEDRVHHEGVWQNGQFSLLPARGVSYFHNPGYATDFIVQKVRLAGNSEAVQIRRAPEYVPETVLQNQSSDKTSPYQFIANYLTVQEGEWWTVYATTAQGQVAVVGQGNAIREVPLHRHFSKVEWWPFAISKTGQLYLRGVSREGVRGLWRWDEFAPELVVAAGDLAQPDGREAAVIGEPLFYAPPLIQGDTLFIGTGLLHPDSSEFIGQGIVKLTAP